MSDDNKCEIAEPMNMAGTASVISHDCYAWNRQHSHNTREYQATMCGTCGKITGFRWRKWWRRIGGLLSHEPPFTTDGPE